MEPLFRMLLVRPAVGAGAPLRPIALGDETPLAQIFASAAEDRPAVLKRTAADVAGSARMVRRSGDLDSAPRLAAFAAALKDLLAGPGPVGRAEVVAAARAAFGAAPDDATVAAQLGQDRARLVESILAIKLLPELHRLPLAELVDSLRLIALIRRTAEDTDFPEGPEELRRALVAPVRLPGDGRVTPGPRRPARPTRGRRRSGTASSGSWWTGIAGWTTPSRSCTPCRERP
ncbi:hypothetical protein [Streptomyces litchfieldiae]|uniref:Uncharacterized protein n=1 Tax=Streptomyces litchfieldiae TaxID=3075543 RepID=A0ABU2MXP4_9ACTN|nr:hypothetical protein [Streptomyces sp. DSM 44938]MDT0346406.1 hypothetical protein [Streptomyces sp. DSM 44938]